MSESAAWWMYFAGVLTLPVVAVLMYAWTRALWRIQDWLDERGWTYEIHDRRGYDREKTDEFGYRDYDKRHAIIWANKWGPVFWGHWCREETRWVVTRWVGFGEVTGRNLVFYRKRTL